jgi:hypothetical protein
VFDSAKRKSKAFLIKSTEGLISSEIKQIHKNAGMTFVGQLNREWVTSV